ncbi:co-chaperone GroES [Candidatus Uhrbacteria bacterium CG_4_9_14_3_um_filter_36_7]|uniref:Co-chaperonin GroES n=1 Tax=Candidatus Uhrbacteria bacterium CG_4_9_14_3_um_filter_36_7 TaxID=1975033 RepID=A0A2M7XHJ8_9BACT|nr:MAG: co-chaperone GroES [Candidatus Uhrbacteria bacterium CG_4_9_14_3_um_filter_36_7]
MKLRPLADHVLVQALSQEQVSASGIILPDTVNKERPERGKVVAIGPGKLLENGQRSQVDVQIGNIVVFKKYSPDEIKVDGEEYLVIRMDDIVAVLDE